MAVERFERRKHPSVWLYLAVFMLALASCNPDVGKAEPVTTQAFTEPTVVASVEPEIPSVSTSVTIVTPLAQATAAIIPPTVTSNAAPAEIPPSQCVDYGFILDAGIEVDNGNFHNPWGVELYSDVIASVAEAYAIPPQILAALADKESLMMLVNMARQAEFNYQPDPDNPESWNLGPCGAAGLTGILGSDHMQYRTAAEIENDSCKAVGFDHRPTTKELALNPDLALEWGARILRHIYDDPELGSGNWWDSLGLYNAGNWDIYQRLGRKYYVNFVMNRAGVPWHVLYRIPYYEPGQCVEEFIKLD
jgi:hypothetical protein